MTQSSLLANSFWFGVNVEDILYGVELIVYLMTIYVLLSSKGAHTKLNLFYALFSSTMVFLVTVWTVTQAIFGRKMWLLNSNYPGGTDTYWEANVGVWYLDWAAIAVIILQLMTDAFMIYRCGIVWNSYRAVLVPVILWLAALALGVLVAWTRDNYTSIASQLILSYWSISVFLSTTSTCMICYRVLRLGRGVREYLGPEHASLCLTIGAIIVESALPSTLSGIAFLVSLGVGSPISTTFTCVYSLMMCISLQTLILRVVKGNAWGGDTFSRPRSAVDFSIDTMLGSHSNGESVHLQTLSTVYHPDAGRHEMTTSQV